MYCFSRGCHICGSNTHKRRDCPKKTITNSQFHKPLIKYALIMAFNELTLMFVVAKMKAERENGIE